MAGGGAPSSRAGQQALRRIGKGLRLRQHRLAAG